VRVRLPTYLTISLLLLMSQDKGWFVKFIEVLNKFLDMLRESTITQSAITLVLICVCAALWLQGKAIPQELWAATTLVLGFFFGAKSKQLMTKG
jgi:hypothetical protein